MTFDRDGRTEHGRIDRPWSPSWLASRAYGSVFPHSNGDGRDVGDGRPPAPFRSRCVLYGAHSRQVHSPVRVPAKHSEGTVAR